MAIRGVIFDYGEVLSLPPDAGNWATLARLAELPEDELQLRYWQFRDEYDRGTVSGPEYWSQIAEAAGRQFLPVTINALIDADCRQWSCLNRPMVALAMALPARGIRTAVLSNMQADLLARMEREFDWLSTFFHHTYSCRVGNVKPEVAIYEHCLRGLQTAPEETLFLDDRLRNVEAARALGIQSHLFTGMETLPAELLSRA